MPQLDYQLGLSATWFHFTGGDSVVLEKEDHFITKSGQQYWMP